MREKDLLQKLKKEDCKILIYGAGMVGSLVFHRLAAGGIPVERIVFAVSRREKEDMYFLGRKVYEVCECKTCFERVHIIIAALPGAHQGMIHTLQENHYYDFDIVDDLLFREMEQGYVTGHNREHPAAGGVRDVLFMASDNNRSSGAFLCMVDLNNELNRRGISTLVVLPAYGSGEELLQANRIDYTYILSRDWLVKAGGAADPRLQENAGAVSALRELIRKYQIKIVHNNTTYTYVGAVAAKEENIPVVWHLREYIKEQGYRFYDEDKAFQLLNRSDAVIVVSDYIRKSYGKLCASIVHKVYDGIDAETFYSRNHELMTGEKARILMPGMVTPLKGQMQLLEAASLLKRQGYEAFEVAFVGNEDPEYADELKKFMNRNGLGGNVSFYGRSSEIARWYLWADIVVVCSGAEAFGRVTVEAQLAGCLVIAADKGATTEIVEDKETGYLYPHGNACELAVRIRNAVRDKDSVRKIAAAGRERAKERFTREQNADEIIRIYDQILKGQNHGGQYALSM